MMVTLQSQYAKKVAKFSDVPFSASFSLSCIICEASLLRLSFYFFAATFSSDRMSPYPYTHPLHTHKTHVISKKELP
ncbi:hypothetical protein L2E82_29925 [Cichorium intybus]|uniref:Uncharacterized protein n=1 Tax=Cichorium intybus TaxID=13427 RepID=A0ACB9CZC8_CICIN|nr:hypothetical protein L2E82_29925 [Cichorium intybus]